MAKPLHELTVAEASRLIRDRKLSPVELAQALIARADAVEPRLNAYLTRTNEQAMAQARQAEAEIAAGRWRGPLHGIPFALKDIYDTRGVLTSGNSRICANRVPSADATVVRKLGEAGAILLGKLATYEFALGGPSYDLPWPPPRNPWNPVCATGGSSSGSAAALAARLVPASLGSDTGGSIRGPASWCGVSGLMPTHGLVSRAGVIPNSFTLDRCGPMARTAEDCALLLDAITGHDPADAGSAHRASQSHAAALTRDLTGLRVGVMRFLWEEDPKASEESRRAIEEALAVLRSLGAEVKDVRRRPLPGWTEIKLTIAETEIFAAHLPALRERPGDFGEAFLLRTLPACLFSAGDYVRATRDHRRAIARMEEFFGGYDVLLTVGQGPAPRLDAGDPLDFWKKKNMLALANVSPGPAAMYCAGFSEGGLPLGMHVIGRPFDDAAVLRVGHAYQQATDWHERMPPLAAPEVKELRPAPAGADDSDAKTRALCDAVAERAGLRLGDRERALLYRAAPHALAVAARLGSDHDFSEQPANVFQVPLSFGSRAAGADEEKEIASRAASLLAELKKLEALDLEGIEPISVFPDEDGK